MCVETHCGSSQRPCLGEKSKHIPLYFYRTFAYKPTRSSVPPARWIFGRAMPKAPALCLQRSFDPMSHSKLNYQTPFFTRIPGAGTVVNAVVITVVSIAR